MILASMVGERVILARLGRCSSLGRGPRVRSLIPPNGGSIRHICGKNLGESHFPHTHTRTDTHWYKYKNKYKVWGGKVNEKAKCVSSNF